MLHQLHSLLCTVQIKIKSDSQALQCRQHFIRLIIYSTLLYSTPLYSIQLAGGRADDGEIEDEDDDDDDDREAEESIASPPGEPSALPLHCLRFPVNVGDWTRELAVDLSVIPTYSQLREGV